MQGTQTAQSIITQLDTIATEHDKWDCVCIIRGGGASTDLDGFDDYELAANVAQFPLPIIVGIGHERDITVLDYIACRRVKTPTAAAEFLLSLGDRELSELYGLASSLLQIANNSISGARQQLAYISGHLPMAPVNALHHAEKRLDAATLSLSRIASTRIQPLRANLDRMADAIANAATNSVRRAAMKLDSYSVLIEALSPKATLKRGFSITKINGEAITNASQLRSGDIISTEFFEGTVSSTVN